MATAFKAARGSSSSRSPLETSSKEPALRALLLYLASERGLADNTLHAYRRDIEDLDRYFRARNKTIIKASADDYRKYLHDQTRSGQSTKTVARRIAAMRVLLRFLVTEGHDVLNILSSSSGPSLSAPCRKC